ncbi:unnamed protein product, partial [Musa textilis]
MKIEGQSTPAATEKVESSTEVALVEKSPSHQKSSRKPSDRDLDLARVETEKNLSLIGAWEDSEKTKSDNKAQKKKSAITSWENSKKASLESQLQRSSKILRTRRQKRRRKYGTRSPWSTKQHKRNERWWRRSVGKSSSRWKKTLPSIVPRASLRRRRASAASA